MLVNEIHLSNFKVDMALYLSITLQAGLSDIFEYMSAEHAALQFEKLSSIIQPGGRIAYWCLYVPRAPPEHLKNKMLYLDQLSKSLHEIDRVWFYMSFNVYQIA